MADEPRAARIGNDLLASGGTAADAAAGMYFALAVTLPSVAGLGGGGACLVYNSAQNYTEMLDFAARSPKDGGPVAIPLAVRGMSALQAKYGRLRWEQIIGPAETMARFGFPVSRALAADLIAAEPILRRDATLARIYLRSNGAPYSEGQMLEQRDLAAVLGALRARGAQEFYAGSVAPLFVDAARQRSAAFTADELRATEPAWRPSVGIEQGNVRMQFVSPPAAAGLVEAEAIGMAAPRWSRATAAERMHLLAQSSQRAWLDRDRWITPEFSSSIGPAQLASAAYLNGLMSNYRPDQRTPGLGGQRREPLEDDAAATSFVTVDRDGNAVSCVISSYGLFGAGVGAPGLGIPLAAAPDTTRGPQWLGPMIATINVDSTFTFGIGARGGPQFMFAGAASGGAGGISALTSVALQALIEKQPLENAIDAQRIHADGGPPDTVFVEANVQPRPAALVERGYTIVPVPVLGRVNGVLCAKGQKEDPGSCEFRADRRGFGLAASSN